MRSEIDPTMVNQTHQETNASMFRGASVGPDRYSTPTPCGCVAPRLRNQLGKDSIMKCRIVTVVWLAGFLVSLVVPRASAQVTADMLLKADQDANNWLTYGKDYRSTRFSSLKQVDDSNVKKLVPKWTFQTGVLDGFECTPLVVDGIMYLTTPWNHAFAIDAKTGRELWHYQKQRRVGKECRSRWSPYH